MKTAELFSAEITEEAAAFQGPASGRENGHMNIKIQEITDIEQFFRVIDSCKGKVELVTGEGDRLNLKSKLSQYVSLANIFSDGTIPQLELAAEDAEDAARLISFMMGKNEP